MVDSRKSAQAKQQRRNRDGTYADEGKTSSMPTGDVLERFEQNQQSNTGGAPVETYETGVKRMQELDQKLIDIANREYSERKFGPDDEGYRVESGLYVSREEFEKLPELDRDRYIAWGNDYMDGNEDAWNDPQQMSELASEAAEDGDAEVYLTNPELTYTDDMDYSFGEYLESKGCDPQSAEEGANMALQGHPDLELTGNTYPQVWPTDADNNHRRAKLFYLGGSKGWRVTFSDGRGDVNNTVCSRQSSGSPSPGTTSPTYRPHAARYASGASITSDGRSVGMMSISQPINVLLPIRASSSPSSAGAYLSAPPVRNRWSVRRAPCR